jgi:8-hydroxy-5-deazaflavin:NADPH oxidoreductase
LVCEKETKRKKKGVEMEIGIIGAGRIGQAVATRLVLSGHQVMLSNSSGPESLREVEKALGKSAHVGTVQEAEAYGEVVVVAIPAYAVSDLPAAELNGKIVVDATNYYAPRDGRISELDGGSIGSSELLARYLPGSRVVKAFNTISYLRLANEARPSGDAERLAIPLAGDDAAAKRVVAALIDDMGFDPVDLGPLANGRDQEPGTPLFDRPLGVAGVRAAVAYL